MLMVNLFAGDMRMRKFIVLLLVVTLLLVAFSGCNEKDTDPGATNWQPNSASDFKYTVDVKKSEIRINKYIGASKVVVIPAEIENMPVVAIEGIPTESDSDILEGGFYKTDVVTVVIPETVRSIGLASFEDCKELTQIVFKEDSNLRSIAYGAFSGCVKLEKIDFSTTKLIAIDMYAFSGCSNLNEIKFPETLLKIGEGAFYECSSLVDVKLPPNLAEMGENVFSYCISLERINIPPNLRLNFFNGSAMHNVPALGQIVFDEGRKEIMGYALIQTNGNVEVIVPKGVEKFSPLPFLFNPPSQKTISFLGDAPEIIEEDAPYWLEGTVVFYDPETSGWENFVWKDKVEMKQSQKN